MRPDFLNPSNSNAFVQVITEFTDFSYDPACIIVEICQQQKNLTDDEIQQVVQRYCEGASIYELADEFGCHRGTINKHLKKQGITVSSKVTDRPVLVERVLQMYADGMHIKRIGAALGITSRSVSKILHDNDVRIRHSSEYAKDL